MSFKSHHEIAKLHFWTVLVSLIIIITMSLNTGHCPSLFLNPIWLLHDLIICFCNSLNMEQLHNGEFQTDFYIIDFLTVWNNSEIYIKYLKSEIPILKFKNTKNSCHSWIEVQCIVKKTTPNQVLTYCCDLSGRTSIFSGFQFLKVNYVYVVSYDRFKAALGVTYWDLKTSSF